MQRTPPGWRLVALGPIVVLVLCAGLFTFRAREGALRPFAESHNVAAALVDAWKVAGSKLALEPDETSQFTCPADGAAASVWGHGPYTSDSSICTAAVNAGLVTFQQGGVVTVAGRPGQQQYGATSR